MEIHSEQSSILSTMVKIDYIRRMDQANAVIHIAKIIWTRLDEISERQNELTNIKRRIAEFAMFFIGCLVSWWITPEGKFEFNFGSWLVLMAAYSYIGFKIDYFSLQREFNNLIYQQTGYRYKWLVIGLIESDFWKHRDHLREEMKIDKTLNSETRDDLQEWLDKKKQNLHTSVSNRLSSKAKGEY